MLYLPEPTRCCNYCDNFIPLLTTTTGPSSDQRLCGVCYKYENAPKLHPFRRSPFYDSGCKKFKSTIHNHFGLDSPMYSFDYYKAYCFNVVLKNDIESYQRKLKNNEKAKQV